MHSTDTTQCTHTHQPVFL